MCSENEFPTRVEQSIKNLIEKVGFSTYEIRKQRVLTNGNSFLSNLYEVDIKGTTKDGIIEINLFLKIINGGEKTKWISIADVYKVELFAYRELSKVFVELQEDANVPSHERYKMVKSYEDSSSEAIILENIARKGFKMYDKVEVVPLELAEKAIKELAKLHGLSFALQEKQPEYFNGTIKEMKYPVIFGDDFLGYVKSMINLTMEYIDDADVKSRVEKKYHKLADKYSQFFENEPKKRCLCYGDYRSGNMMIKIHNTKVTDFIAVDYQTLHYGCPAIDVLFFIFMNTDQQFRKVHLSHLKDLYHATLKMFLEYFNIDVDLVYPREMFEEDFKKNLDYGLVIGFTFLPLVLVKEDDVPDMTGEVSGIRFQVHDAFRDRQRGMIEEFIEWGYI